VDKKKIKRTAKKAVSWASAIVSALKDPAVRDMAQAALKQNAERVAAQSAAAQAERFFAAATEQRVIAALEVGLLIAQKQLAKKG